MKEMIEFSGDHGWRLIVGAISALLMGLLIAGMQGCASCGDGCEPGRAAAAEGQGA